MRTNVLRKLGHASQAGRAVVVGGLAAVSLAVTGVALAVPGSPVSFNSDATVAATQSPTAEPSEDATKAPKPKPAKATASPDASPRPRPTCPWPVTASPAPAVSPTAAPHDQGLHCGWYKPGHRDGKHPGSGNGGLDHSSPRPHPTGAPEHDGQHGKGSAG